MRNGEWANQTLNFLLLIARALPRGKSWSVLSHLCRSSSNTGLYLPWAFLFFLTSSGEERIANNIRSQCPRRNPLKARKGKDLLPFFFLNSCLGGHFGNILSVCTGMIQTVGQEEASSMRRAVSHGWELSSVFCHLYVQWHGVPFPASPFMPHPSSLPCFWWSNSHDCPAWESIRTPLAWAGSHCAASCAFWSAHPPWPLPTRGNSTPTVTGTMRITSINCLVENQPLLVYLVDFHKLGSKRRKESFWKFPWFLFKDPRTKWDGINQTGCGSGIRYPFPASTLQARKNKLSLF